MPPIRPVLRVRAARAAIALTASAGDTVGELTSWGSIDVRNTRNTRWAIELFGTVKVGIHVPDFMESYFIGPASRKAVLP